MTRIFYTGLLCLLTLTSYTQQLTIDNQGHAGLIHDIAFINNGTNLLSISEDKTIRIWDVAGGTLHKTYRLEQEDGVKGKIYASVLSPDERYLYLGGYFGNQDDPESTIGQIRIFDLKNERLLPSLIGHSNVVLDLVISKDGSTLISSSADQSIIAWDLRSSSIIFEISDFEEHINTLAIHPSGKVIVAGDDAGYVRTWDLSGSKPVTYKAKVHSSSVRSLIYTKSGVLYSTGDDRQIIKWSGMGKLLGIVDQTSSPLYSLELSKDNKFLVAFSRQGYVYGTSSESKVSVFDAHSNVVTATCQAPFETFDGVAGNYIASAGGDEKNILIWDINTGTIVRNLVGQGKSVFAVGINESNNAIGFGQTNTTGNLDDVKLEKSFDLNSLTLNRTIAEPDSFHKAKIAGIVKESKNMITVGGNSVYTNSESDGEIRSFSMVNDDQAFVIGSSYSLNKYRSNGEILGKFKGQQGEIWSLTEFKTQDLLIAGISDQTIRVWNNINGELLVTLFVATDNEWVIWTPQGFYEASAGGEKYIGWLINKGGNKLAGFQDVSSFRKHYHRRDVIMKMLELKSFDAVASALDVDAKPQPTIPPSIDWISPIQTTSLVNGNNIKVSFYITSNSTVTELKLMANGRPLIKKSELSISGNGQPERIDLSVEVPIESNNTYSFTVFAKDQHANTNSKERIVSFSNPVANTTSDTSPTKATEQERGRHTLDPVVDKRKKGDLYMVSIGISEFADSKNNLNFAANDALSMSETFKNQNGKMYNSVKTINILNEKATRTKILSTFQNLEKYTTVDDFVIIFIASHGLNDNNNFYILPHDGNPANPRLTCVDWRDFSDLVGNMAAKVLLFIDTCHSGQLGNNIGQKANDNTEAVRELSGKDYGVVIMAAATGEEYSLEHPDWQHGAFTLSILEGINEGKADIKADGIIYLRELDYYLAERVKELTGGRQHPTTQKPSSISRLELAKIN